MADLAQYAIDIAARMTGTETFGQLDQLTATLAGAGKGAEHFQQAIQRLSSDLEVARGANEAAQAALGEGSARYRELEVAADKAAKALERAPAEQAKAMGALTAAQNALKAAQADGVGDDALKGYEMSVARAERAVARLSSAERTVGLQEQAAASRAALEGYSATLADLEGDAKRAAEAEAALTRQLTNVRTAATHVDKRLAMNSEGLAKLQAGFSASGTSAGRLGARLIAPVKGFADLSQVVGKANAALLLGVSAAAAAVIAVAAVGVAAVAAVGGILAWSVGLADARRSAGLARDAAEALNPALGGLRGEIASLARDTGVSSETLRGLAVDLSDAKVNAADMPAALRAAAVAEAALGQGGAARFVAELKAGKKGAAELARETQAKFGGVVAKQMLGLGAQAARFKENVGGLFGGLDIEPVLLGLQTLVNLFDANSASGRAMKAAFEGIFQPIANGAQYAAWVVEAFVLGVLIGATKLYIKMKPAIKAVAGLFDIDISGATLEDTLAGISTAGEVLAPVLLGVGAAVAAVVAGVGLLAAAFAAVSFGTAALLFGTMGRAIYTIIAGAAGAADKVRGFAAALGGAVTDAVAFARGALLGFAATLGGVGGAMIDGLVRGITGAAGRVSGALTDVVKGAVGAAKAALGIASPSRVMADEVAAPIVAGTEGELDRGAERVQRAMTAMVAPPDVPAGAVALAPAGAPAGAGAPGPAGAPAAAPSAGGARGGLDLSGSTFVFNGVADAEQAEVRFGELFTRLLEGDVLALGAEAAA